MAQEKASQAGMKTAAEAFQEALRAGASLLAEGNSVEAQRWVRGALQLRPGNPRAQNLMGVIYLEDGAYELAHRVFEALIRRVGDSVVIRLNAGLAALGCQQYDRALVHFRHAVGLDPKRRRGFAYLAFVHLQQGDRDFAAAALLEAGLAPLVQRLRSDQSAWSSSDESSVLADLGSEAAAMARDAGAWPSAQDGFVEARAADVIGARAPGASDAAAAKAFAQRSSNEPLPPGTVDVSPSSGALVGGATIVVQGASVSGSAHAGVPTVRRVSGDGPASVVAGAASRPSEVDAAPTVELCDGRAWVRCGKWASAPEPGDVIVNKDALALTEGRLEFDNAACRVKGMAAGLFGGTGTPFLRVRGDGMALLDGGEQRRLELFRLLSGGEVVVRQSAIMAFSSRLYWQNGRIPAGGPRMVRLAGEGFVLAGCRQRVLPCDVRSGTAMTVRGSAFLGWAGDVIVLPTGRSPVTQPAASLCCEGTGTALVQ